VKWEDTIAARCRYGYVAGTIWGKWTILWEDSEDDYSGHARFLAYHNGTYVYYSWSYGSCSGCDDWEARDLRDGEIANEMDRDAVRFRTKETVTLFISALPEPTRTAMLKSLPTTIRVTQTRKGGS